ncbi:MAG: hypothetical protein ACTHW2_10135 [Tissierella sp.]|uniref:hypothetical protein n=1 Tax=Tissierella sp. TaxID=41274 RepID=UPI003F9BD61E
MFAQILLGIFMIIIGVFHLMNSKLFLGNRAKRNIKTKKIKSFQKGMVLPHFLLGMLFISMGIVEKMFDMQRLSFIGLYVVLGAIPLGMILINNKKHSGSYWLG